MRTRAVCLAAVTIACSACNSDPAPPAPDVVVEDATMSASPHRRHCFRRIDLGTLGGADSDVVAINRRGEIVGNSETAAGESHAYLWRRGAMIDLGTLGGSQSLPRALDDRGRVVGESTVGSSFFPVHAFVWHDSVMTDLTPDAFNAVANDINDRGQIVGTSSEGNFADATAVLWWHGATVDLGAGAGSGAIAINERGDIIGSGNAGDFLWRGGMLTLFAGAALDAIDRRGRVIGYRGAVRAFVWQDGVTVDLGTLGGAQSAALAGNGEAIVGWAENANGQMHAALWRRRRAVDLHVLGDADAIATGINARGDIVGHASGAGPTHAFFWSDGEATDLGETLGDVVLDDTGEVASAVSVGAHGYHAVLWRPRHCADERAPAVEEAVSPYEGE